MNLSLGPGPLIGFIDEILGLREEIEKNEERGDGYLFHE